jgi:hypothetical protein
MGFSTCKNYLKRKITCITLKEVPETPVLKMARCTKHLFCERHLILKGRCYFNTSLIPGRVK